MPRGQTNSAATLIPVEPTLDALREAAAHCQACPLWQSGTQTVFGEGNQRAATLFVGEQPGDQEDQVGKPFVGPAGQVFDRALHLAGIDRSQLYVTNVVKHFKWIAKGSRRIHQSPNKGEVTACRPWLEAEIAIIQPQIIVCLGAVAARALLGETFRVTRQRGEFLPSPLAPWILATVHPSAILRMPDEQTRDAAFHHFADDLKKVAAKIQR
jgi:uracil-DNA glycosylase